MKIKILLHLVHPELNSASFGKNRFLWLAIIVLAGLVRFTNNTVEQIKCTFIERFCFLIEYSLYNRKNLRIYTTLDTLSKYGKIRLKSLIQKIFEIS